MIDSVKGQTMPNKKVMFLVCNGAEARIVNFIWRSLEAFGAVNLLSVTTGSISREKSDQSPEDALSALGMPFKKLSDYRTFDINKIMKKELPDVKEVVAIAE